MRKLTPGEIADEAIGLFLEELDRSEILLISVARSAARGQSCQAERDQITSCRKKAIQEIIEGTSVREEDIQS